MKKSALGIGLGVLTLVGCTMLPSVGPDYERDDLELPAYAMPDAGLPTTNRTVTGEYGGAAGESDFRTAITTNSVRFWWTRFNDGVLENLVALAVTNNLSFQMAQERLTAARYELLGAYAAFMPKMALDGNANWYEYRPNTSRGAGAKNHGELFNAACNVSWELDLFGGNRRAAEAAWAEAEAAGWSVADAWLSLVSEVGNAYLNLRITQQRIAVARTNLVLQSETYDILKSRLDSGIGDELAVNQSKYIVDQTHAGIPPLLAQEEQLKNALAILTGGIPGDRHELLEPIAERDWLIAPEKLAETPLDMIRARPDVRIAERRLAAQTARIGVAKALWYPKLFINGSLGFESAKFKDLLKADSFFAAIGPSISWPIFQGGSIYARVKVEEARTREAYLAYAQSVEQAYGEVRDAYAAYTQEYHRYEALKGAVKAAEDAVAISNDLYKNGLRDFTAVIDAQRSLLSLAEQLVISRGTITLDEIRLYKALGGGIGR